MDKHQYQATNLYRNTTMLVQLTLIMTQLSIEILKDNTSMNVENVLITIYLISLILTVYCH